MVRVASIFCIVLLFSGWQAQQVTGNPVTVAIQAGKIAYQVYETVQKVIKYFTPNKSFDDKLTQEDLMVFNKLDHISDRIDNFQNELFQKMSQNLYSKFLAKTKDFYKTVKYIDLTYSNFHEYTKNLSLVPEEVLDSIVFSSLGWSVDHVTAQIQNMHQTLTEPDAENESLLDFLSRQNDPELMCLRHQSLQQVMWEMYNAVVATDLKGLALKLMSLQYLNYKKNFTKNVQTDSESISEIGKFNTRVSDTYKATVTKMAKASRELWKCDVQSPTKDHSYSKLQEVFQALLTFEKDTTLDHCHFGECYEMNTQSERLTYKNNTHFSHLQPEKLRCNGQITDCKETSQRTKFCVARPESDRRYLGMMTSYNWGAYNPDCELHDKAVEEKDGGYLCRVCVCTCATNNLEIDRYFSLEPAKSTITLGMVVTGVRLRKINHVFYIEVQEGFLGANGSIVGEVNWKRLPNNKTINFDKIVRNNPPEHYRDFLANDKVFAVHWEQKTVLLDDIKDESSDQDLVLTGLQFIQSNDALMLQVRLSPIDYKTGRILEEGEWYHNKATGIKGRDRVMLSESRDPLAYFGHTTDKMNSNRYLKFQVTNLKADMGQSTVPYLDVQEVVTNPPTPVSGAGLYHKSERSGKSGGFLGLKLIQYDFAKHLL